MADTIAGATVQGSARWPGVIDDEATASCLLDLVSRSESWLHRRVDAVGFSDNRTAAYRVSLDFTVPPETPLVGQDASGDPIRLLPLSMLRKQPLAHLDVRSESGRSLPVLTTNQNGRLAHLMLRWWAAGILSGPVPEPLDELFEVLVRCPASEGPEHLRRFEEGPVEGADRAREALIAAADGMFAALVEDLTEHFLLIVLLAAADHERRVVKLSYDIPYTAGTDASRWRGLPQRLGWASSSTEFDVVPPMIASSHHFEVAQPDDVEVVDLCITRVPTGSCERVDPRGRHVHAHLGPLQEGEGVVVTVGLLPQPHGWLRTCWVGSAAVTALLLFLTGHLEAIVPGMEPDRPAATAAPLVLAVAGLAVSLAVRPREHALATHLLSVLRWVAAVPPSCAFALAAVLTVGPEPVLSLPAGDVGIRDLWYVLVALCTLAAIVVTVAAWFPRRRVTPAE